MGVQAKLVDIIDGLESQSNECTAFFRKQTGEVVIISDEELRAAENEESLEDYPAWQQDMIQSAQDIFENPDGYFELPSQYEIHEYALMERFGLSVEHQGIAEELLSAIKGRGAFRRFKEAIHRLEVADVWYQFRTQALHEIAIEWSKKHGIDYIDG